MPWKNTAILDQIHVGGHFEIVGGGGTRKTALDSSQ
jgi:hypothetical protein